MRPMTCMCQGGAGFSSAPWDVVDMVDMHEGAMRDVDDMVDMHVVGISSALTPGGHWGERQGRG